MVTLVAAMLAIISVRGANILTAHNGPWLTDRSSLFPGSTPMQAVSSFVLWVPALPESLSTIRYSRHGRNLLFVGRSLLLAPPLVLGNDNDPYNSMARLDRNHQHSRLQQFKRYDC